MSLTADRVLETSTTTGTGTVTLAGAVAQFRAFQTAFAVGAIVQYAIVGQTGTEWEVGTGTLVTATTLSRDTVASSSNANALVSLSAGTKNVFATVTAAQLHLLGGGATVASASALPVPTGRVIHVTGIASIASITSTNLQAGAVVTLIFDDVGVSVDAYGAGNLHMPASFSPLTGDTITFAYDGTTWYETARATQGG